MSDMEEGTSFYVDDPMTDETPLQRLSKLHAAPTPILVVELRSIAEALKSDHRSVDASLIHQGATLIEAFTNLFPALKEQMEQTEEALAMVQGADEKEIWWSGVQQKRAERAEALVEKLTRSDAEWAKELVGLERETAELHVAEKARADQAEARVKELEAALNEIERANFDDAVDRWVAVEDLQTIARQALAESPEGTDK